MALLVFSRKPALLSPPDPTINKGSVQAKGLIACWPISGTGDPYIRDIGPFGKYHGSVGDTKTQAFPTARGYAIGNPTVQVSAGVAIANGADLAAWALNYGWGFSCWASATLTSTTGPAWMFYGTDDLGFYPYDPVNGVGPRVFWRDLGGSILDGNAGPAADGSAHHFVFCTYASNDHRLFIDGVQSLTSTATGSAGPFTNLAFAVYFENQSQIFPGALWDYRLYNPAPTAPMIAEMYRRPMDLYSERSRRVFAKAAAAAGGQPTMRRWGGVPHLSPSRPHVGRGW